MDLRARTSAAERPSAGHAPHPKARENAGCPANVFGGVGTPLGGALRVVSVVCQREPARETDPGDHGRSDGLTSPPVRGSHASGTGTDRLGRACAPAGQGWVCPIRLQHGRQTPRDCPKSTGARDVIDIGEGAKLSEGPGAAYPHPRSGTQDRRDIPPRAPRALEMLASLVGGGPGGRRSPCDRSHRPGLGPIASPPVRERTRPALDRAL